MANAVYDKGREAFLTGGINWTGDTISVALVRGYTPNASTHQYVSDVTGAGGALVATANLASKTATAGVADAADVTFSTVASGSACNHLVFYKNTGSNSTSNLVCVIDTATGLPVTPNGGDISLVFDNGTNKIFKL